MSTNKPELTIEQALVWRTSRRARVLAEVAMETTIGDRDPSLEGGVVPSEAIAALTEAIVRISCLNDDPRLVIEHVVKLLDMHDVDAVRAKMDREERGR
jgi:hypothetical protein